MGGGSPLFGWPRRSKEGSEHHEGACQNRVRCLKWRRNDPPERRLYVLFRSINYGQRSHKCVIHCEAVSIPIKAELRLRMHEPAADVGAWLRKVVAGYYRYHAIPGNIDRLSIFGQRLRRLWWYILRRRSQRPMGSAPSDLPTVDSSTPRTASLSYSSFRRHSFEVGAVCVEAPVRICAGGDQR
jgi:hypothetical protein